MSAPDPHDVLGLPQRSDRQDVKRVFRKLALQYHPDKNPSPAARQRYQDIQAAARQLLGQAESGQQLRRPSSSGWGGSSGEKSTWSRISRSRSFPMVFCAASLVGGCLIFMAALHVHTDLYTYNIAEEVEARRQAPTQMQQRIGQLLMERRQQQRHDQSAGAPSNSSTGKPG